ncbi:MAG: aryl-sulfate sulfotransferase [Candidatus Pseudobacter hemicellulosilyticus]|uniref:Aryl-sulfate sulfotransferase n=1 Tax=Candidatus Pseudobacter hemicellulosilyticus TaxID=3121375 RepID=A0AAJ5WRH1_9BACT|nr:MAG: aryl-sulfate sulfotransferase [Pseudobacter sp.]
MRLKNFIFWVVSGSLSGAAFLSCSRSGTLHHEPVAVRVQNDSLSALSARIRFSLDQAAPASIVYWEKGTTLKFNTPENSTRLQHSIPLFHLKEQTAYEFSILTEGAESSTHAFTTAAIPAHVKKFYSEEQRQIRDANNGYILFYSRYAPATAYLIDPSGKIAWYRTTPHMLKVARLTQQQTLLWLEDEHNTSFGDGNVILETSLAGDTLFYLKQGQKGFDRSVHHDLDLNPKGNIVAVTNVLQGSAIPGDGLMELDRQGNKIWEWTTFDTPDAADLGIHAQPWINSLDIDTDGNYIVSLRAFSQVWKINAASGSIHWKLGKNGNVAMDPQDHFQFQHYAHRNPAGHIMLFDNGSADRPFSRLLSFQINEQTLQASPVIRQELPAQYYSAIMGSTMLLPDQQLLTASSNNSTILKTSASGDILWTLKVAEPVYRAEYIGDPFPR